MVRPSIRSYEAVEEEQTGLHALVWEDAQIILTGSSQTQICYHGVKKF